MSISKSRIVITVLGLIGLGIAIAGLIAVLYLFFSLV